MTCFEFYEKLEEKKLLNFISLLSFILFVFLFRLEDIAESLLGKIVLTVIIFLGIPVQKFISFGIATQVDKKISSLMMFHPYNKMIVYFLFLFYMPIISLFLRLFEAFFKVNLI